MPLGLDAFGDDCHVQAVAQRRDRAYDRRGVAVTVNVAHERAVDLDLAERKRAQVADRRIADAEIVEQDAYAERPQRVQRGEVDRVVGKRHRLGDLELDARRRQPADLQRCPHHPHQVAALQLHRRQIDRHPHVRRPACGPGERLDDPGANVLDQAGFLRQRDEVVGHDQAAGRVVPAQQGLEGPDLVVDQADDRLIGISSPLSMATRGSFRAFGGLVPVRPSRAERSCRCRDRASWRRQGQVRLLQQLVRIHSVAGISATPTLVPTTTWWPPTSNGAAITRTSRCAGAWAAPAARRRTG